MWKGGPQQPTGAHLACNSNQVHDAHVMRRCLAEKMGDPDFGPNCRGEVIGKLQRRCGEARCGEGRKSVRQTAHPRLIHILELSSPSVLHDMIHTFLHTLQAGQLEAGPSAPQGLQTVGGCIVPHGG